MNNPGDDSHHSFDFWQVLKRQIGFITIAFLTITAATLAVTYFKSRSYLAKAALEVKSDDPHDSRIFSSPNAAGYDEAFVATQAEIMRTNAVLKPVVEKLDLVKKLSGAGPQLSVEQAVDVLRRQLIVEERKGTNMVVVGVSNKDPKLAADIANAVAATYEDAQRKLRRDSINWRLSEMANEVQGQRQKVIVAHQGAIHLLADLGIVDNDPLNPAAPVAAANSVETSKPQIRQYLDAKTEYLEEKRNFDSMNMILETERMKEAVEGVPTHIWAKATAPSGYAWTNAKACIALALVIGVVFSVGFAFLIEYLRTKPNDSLPPGGGLAVAAI